MALPDWIYAGSPYSEAGDGYLYLGEAVRWIASNGGRLNNQQTADRWDDAEEKLVGLLSAGAFAAEGAGRDGTYSTIPKRDWVDASSADVRDGRVIQYLDRSVSGRLGGSLEVGTRRWNGVRVRKADIAERWDFPLRDTLVELAALGRLKPEEAEAEAAKLGIEPLVRSPSDPGLLDVTKEPTWSIAMALAWIEARDIGAVRAMWDRWRAAQERWVSRRCEPEDRPPYDGYSIENPRSVGMWALSPNWRSAWAELTTALRAGTVEASGRPSGGEKRQAIPTIEWQDLDLYEVNRRIVVRADRGSGPGYDEVVLPALEISKLWKPAAQPAIGLSVVEPATGGEFSLPDQPWLRLQHATTFALYGRAFHRNFNSVADLQGIDGSGGAREGAILFGLSEAERRREQGRFDQALSEAAFRQEVIFRGKQTGKAGAEHQLIDYAYFMKPRGFSDLDDEIHPSPTSSDVGWDEVLVERASYVTWLQRTYPSLLANEGKVAASDTRDPSKRAIGRPHAVAWQVVEAEVRRLMDHHGEFSDDDPEWNARARLEEKLLEFCGKKFDREPAPSTLKVRLGPMLTRWRQDRAAMARN